MHIPGPKKPNISPKTLAGNGYQEAEPVQIKALEGFKVPTDPEIGRMLSFFVFEIPMCWNTSFTHLGVFYIVILPYYRYI